MQELPLDSCAKTTAVVPRPKRWPCSRRPPAARKLTPVPFGLQKWARASGRAAAVPARRATAEARTAIDNDRRTCETQSCQYCHVNFEMSLRHGLIGLLAREGPQTGYQLTKAFHRSVNFVWHAVHGQIYPELARLVAKATQPVDDGGTGLFTRPGLYTGVAR